jgi:putative tricarboxylic transport membrane protein
VLFAFGIIGYFFRRYHFTLVSFMLGILLGKQIDNEMYRFAALFGHNPTQVLMRPITMGFIALIIVTVVFQIRRTLKNRKTSETEG